MTEYELLDALGTFSSGMQSWIALYFSGVSAYLIVAYMVGKKLTKPQAITISGGFVLFAILCIMGFSGLGLRLAEITGELRELRPEQAYLTSESGVLMSSLVLIIGILASLRFMWSIRHPKTE